MIADHRFQIQAHSLVSPIMGLMAQDYLAIQGSSVPSERKFSLAKLTDDDHRQRLTAEHFGDIQIIKDYQKVTQGDRNAEKAEREAGVRKVWSDAQKKEKAARAVAAGLDPDVV